MPVWGENCLSAILKSRFSLGLIDKEYTAIETEIFILLRGNSFNNPKNLGVKFIVLKIYDHFKSGFLLQLLYLFRYKHFIGQTMKNLFTSNAVQDNTNLNMNEFGVYVGETREPNFEVAVIQPQSSRKQRYENRKLRKERAERKYK